MHSSPAPLHPMTMVNTGRLSSRSAIRVSPAGLSRVGAVDYRTSAAGTGSRHGAHAGAVAAGIQDCCTLEAEALDRHAASPDGAPAAGELSHRLAEKQPNV